MKFRKELENAFPYSSPEGVRNGLIRMDLNENAFGCSPKVLEAIRELSPMDIAMYPDYAPLLELLSEKNCVKKNQILLAAGGDDALRCIMQAVFSTGNEMIIPDPNYSMYEILSLPLGGIPVKLKLEKNGRISNEHLFRFIHDRTAMVVLTNPPSPIGKCLERKNLIELLEKYRDICFLIDETYTQFIGSHFLDLIAQYKNLAVIQSFSKLYGLAGLRVGIIYSHEDNIQEFSKTAMPYALNTAAVKAAEAALKDEEWLKITRKKIEEEKNRLIKFFQNKAVEVLPSFANFILVDLGIRKEIVFRKLAENGILVKDMKSYPHLENFLRITVGNPEWNDKLISIVEKEALYE